MKQCSLFIKNLESNKISLQPSEIAVSAQFLFHMFVQLNVHVLQMYNIKKNYEKTKNKQTDQEILVKNDSLSKLIFH